MGERVLTPVVRACTALGALAIAVMMLATCWDVVARAAVNAPLHGVVELVEIMVLASVMLGMPEVFLRDEQIRVDLIDDLLPARLLAVLKVVALVLSIVLLAVFAINVYQPMLDAHRFGDVKYDLNVPLYPLYGLIIFSFGVSILGCIAALLRELRAGGG